MEEGRKGKGEKGGSRKGEGEGRKWEGLDNLTGIIKWLFKKLTGMCELLSFRCSSESYNFFATVLSMDDSPN